MGDPVLEARQVSKTYVPQGDVLGRRRQSVEALKRVTLSVQPGEAVGIVGESGSGKTTLARVLIGLLKPDAGQALIRGEEFHALRGERLRTARCSVQYIFQDPVNSLNPRMTVEDTLGEPLIIHRLAAGRARRRRVEQLLESVQLPVSYCDRLPRQLSGGERQRVGIARALATEPAALICDEPIASLDVSVGARILELLRRFNRERGMALLFISHDLRAVAALCRRIIVMKQGQVVESASTAQLIARPQQPYTQLLLRSASLDLS